MVMNDAEIISNFKQAKNKKSQVQILADLNGVPKKEMQEYLKALGLEVPSLRGVATKDLPSTSAPADSLATLLVSLCQQYPEAKVRSGSGEINAVTVTTRYRLDGHAEWTDILLDAATGEDHG